jgi:putative component of membrane protein insertase Oxa1/YidC/SpoIIIJ protein YidD
MPNAVSRMLAKPLIGLVRFYRLAISPWLGSNYPWGGSGYDPVPGTEQKTDEPD